VAVRSAGRDARLQKAGFSRPLEDVYSFTTLGLVSAANAWDKMLDYAGPGRAEYRAFKACMTARKRRRAVDASIANAKRWR